MPLLRPGFSVIVPNPAWPDASAIPDLTGKTAIVLGGNSGLGYETALQLARNGARVYPTARTLEKSNEAVLKIKKELHNEQSQVFPLEVVLEDLTQVRDAARAFAANHQTLDILVNNAGTIEREFRLTKDGIEVDFSVNYLSHFVFTTTLLPILSPTARIVNVTSSQAQQTGPLVLDLARINDPTDKTLSPWLARYSHTKVAQVLFTRGLQRRVGPGVAVNASHPGQITSRLTRHIGAPGTGLLGTLIRLGNRLYDEPVAVGALTQLYLATSPEVESKGIRGQLFFPVAQNATDKLNPAAQDEEMVERYWKWTEGIVKEKVKDQ